MPSSGNRRTAAVPEPKQALEIKDRSQEAAGSRAENLLRGVNQGMTESDASSAEL